MSATCFGLYLDHLQACQYKNLTNEDIIKILPIYLKTKKTSSIPHALPIS